jgi:SnoaL-like domain
MSELIERYLRCWNETEPATRRRLIEQTWTTDAGYVDPMSEVQGIEAIEAVIVAVQGQFPGLLFSAVGTPDTHHRQARFSWGLGEPGQEPIVVGFDVAVLAEDGRISQVYGFLDKVPG